MVIFIIAGPQFGSKLETVKRQGVEIMVCLDVSNSMLAEDVSPNRLDKAKQMLSRLTDGFTNDKVGLIVFAGDAFTQLPITSDYISAKMFLSSINPSMVSTQGTAIGAAINLAARSFTPDETELDSKVYSEYDEQFQIFAWIALFLLIADFMTLDRKNHIFRKVKLFS